ncbi:AraC family transcriptional regulator [Gorillibacterium sp. sgz5001074]|uniref:AraC family transcriptional regulator n=1 Tax=Gorillibacterium sp. sgz5001074 TaxID=3446695 RepID=UPI003F666F07
MDIRMEVFPEYRIVYMRRTGPYGPANGEVMEAMKEWARGRGLLTESAVLFGVPQDPPGTTPPEACRYDACLVLQKDEPLDESLHEGKLGGGEYMVLPIPHTAEAVQEAWASLMPTLHRLGLQLDFRPILERYRGDLVSHGWCELCVPVKR